MVMVRMPETMLKTIKNLQQTFKHLQSHMHLCAHICRAHWGEGGRPILGQHLVEHLPAGLRRAVDAPRREGLYGLRGEYDY
eukprot:9952700-Heterocapsa_arctica.AAC.1